VKLFHKKSQENVLETSPPKKDLRNRSDKIDINTIEETITTMKSPSNHRRQQQEQPRQKEFGELFTIHKPDLTNDSDLSENSDDHHQDEDPFHIRFDMTPEFPSHVPTPETIDEVENEQRPWIPRIFSGEDDKEDDIPTARSPITPTASRKTLSPAYSPRATRWGSDVWNPEVWNLLRTNTLKAPVRPIPLWTTMLQVLSPSPRKW